MDISEADVKMTIISNLRVLVSKELLLAYLRNMGKDFSLEEIYHFWRYNVCLEDDLVYEGILTVDEKSLMKKMNLKMRDALKGKKGEKEVESFLLTEVWEKIEMSLRECLKMLSDGEAKHAEEP